MAEVEIAGEVLFNILRNKKQYQLFMKDSLKFLRQMEAEIKNPTDADPQEIFRLVHTLKGNAATFGLKGLVELLHRFEADLQDLQATHPASTLNANFIAIANYFHNLPHPSNI